MVARRPSWILNIKVCYRYFSATTGWIFSNFLYTDSPWALVVQYRSFIHIWKPIWPPGDHLEFWTSKFVTAISQQLLYGLFPNFVYRFPLGPSCATSLFIQVWKPIWPPGGHLEFWTSKFITAISQQLLDGFFPNFVYRFHLGPSCATSLFYSDLKTSMAARQPSWILNIKVCYRYFSASTGWIFSNFCIQIPLGP